MANNPNDMNANANVGTIADRGDPREILTGLSANNPKLLVAVRSIVEQAYTAGTNAAKGGTSGAKDAHAFIAQQYPFLYTTGT